MSHHETSGESLWPANLPSGPGVPLPGTGRSCLATDVRGEKSEIGLACRKRWFFVLGP